MKGRLWTVWVPKHIGETEGTRLAYPGVQKQKETLDCVFHSVKEDRREKAKLLSEAHMEKMRAKSHKLQQVKL